MLAFHIKPNKKDLIWCEICCCELNTQKALELHNQSPKHQKKEEAFTEIMQLKKEYIDNKKNLDQNLLIQSEEDEVETRKNSH